jgi:hypothetical protein
VIDAQATLSLATTRLVLERKRNKLALMAMPAKDPLPPVTTVSFYEDSFVKPFY